MISKIWSAPEQIQPGNDSSQGGEKMNQVHYPMQNLRLLAKDKVVISRYLFHPLDEKCEDSLVNVEKKRGVKIVSSAIDKVLDERFFYL